MPTQSACANVYVDGANFYYTILNSSERRLDRLKRAWCNFWLLGEKLVDRAFPGVDLGVVKYFTARVGEHEQLPEEATRQDFWLDALQAGSDYRVKVITGFYDTKPGKQRVEKQTDVNIAISIVRDCLMSPRTERATSFVADPFASCDRVVLVSGDRDLRPALKMVDRYGILPVVFRPGREDEISDTDLLSCLLPQSIKSRYGKVVTWDDYVALKRGRW